MKIYIKLLALTWLLYSSEQLFVAQNILPITWQIESVAKHETELKSANMLLSWERQGLSSLNGHVLLTNSFNIPPKFAVNKWRLNVCLQCNVDSIVINGHTVAKSLPNLFWSNRGTVSTFDIPRKHLTDRDNTIKLYLDELSYTGGISHNSCELVPINSSYKSSIEIDVPYEHHIAKGNMEPWFTVKCQTEATAIARVCVKNDFHTTIIDTTFVLPKGKTETKIAIPTNGAGFYECCAFVNDGGNIGSVEWIALNPDKINCKPQPTKGYNEYWQNAVNELSAIEPNFRMHKVDSLCAGKRDGYVVEMQSLNNLTIRGYLFLPRTAGPHAAILHLPGYGYGFENIRDFNNGDPNVAEFALCIRGHGISADVFNPLSEPTGIWGYKLYSDTDNAYRGIYMDCVRAVDFLASQKEIDVNRIGVMGGSQGGGLTIITAGLCANRIAACAYFDPFLCDLDHFLKIRTLCNNEISNSLAYYNNEHTLAEAMSVQRYIDSREMAERITCPTLFACSLFDDDCPPHVGFSAYNAINAPKSFIVFPNDSHLGESDYNSAFFAFFKREFNF